MSENKINGDKIKIPDPVGLPLDFIEAEVVVKPLLKTKTFWTAAAGLVGLAGAFMMGEMSLAEVIPAAAAFIVAMTFRQKLPKAIEVDE